MNMSYVVIPLIVIFVSVVGGLVTGNNMSWYSSLKVPSWNPPGWLFGPVWTTIFILTAISAIIFWNAPRTSLFSVIVAVFIANAFFNVAWSWLFFGFHEVAFALFDAVLIELSVIALIVMLWSVSKVASLLLLPYALWVGFACVLNYVIWYLNS